MDVDADLDGQARTGSPDVEDRHATTLASLEAADLVLVVGRPDLHGIHSLASILVEVLGTGVPAHRVLPVVVASPRSPVARSSITATIGQLVGDEIHEDGATLPALHLRPVRHLDDLHDRVGPLPAAMCQPLGRQLTHLLEVNGPRPNSGADGHRVRPGELGLHAEPTRFGPGDHPFSRDSEVA